MRILCDQNVASKSVTAFENADDITVGTVADLLSHDHLTPRLGHTRQNTTG